MEGCSTSAKLGLPPGVSDTSQETDEADRRFAPLCGHVWYVCSHARPTYCNVCREKLSGMAWHGLSCEICRMKAHKCCAPKLSDCCKWTDDASIPSELRIFDSAGLPLMPHQWIEGNLPIGCRCAVCERTCGSVLKLQDCRCLWCAICVHDQCRDVVSTVCSLGPSRLSVVAPVALQSLQPLGGVKLRWKCLGGEFGGGSPLLVLVNTKSGENQGMRVLTRFKRLVNPAQVVDIIVSGPDYGLKFFQKFDSFRVIVCGGDGTVGWVLSAIDRLGLLTRCQLGVLPLGTGNDLARVLGWGRAFDDDTQLPHVIEKFERAHSRMLDRWSVMTYDVECVRSQSREANLLALEEFESSISEQLSRILQSCDDSAVFSSARMLYETIREFISLVRKTLDVVAVDTDKDVSRSDREERDDGVVLKCDAQVLKLENLVRVLETESSVLDEPGIDSELSSAGSVENSLVNRQTQRFRAQRELLMGRENSLKKAVREIAAHAGNTVGELPRADNESSTAKRERFRKKRSKTTPGMAGKGTVRIHLAGGSLGSLGVRPPFTVGGDSEECCSAGPSSPSNLRAGETSPSEALNGSQRDLNGDLPDEDPSSNARLTSPCIGCVEPPTPSRTPSATDPLKLFDEASPSWTDAGTSTEVEDEQSAEKTSSSHSDFHRVPSDGSQLDRFAELGAALLRSQRPAVKQSSENDLLSATSVSKLQKKRVCGDLKSRSEGSICGSEGANGYSPSGGDGALDLSKHLGLFQNGREKFVERKVMNNYFGIGLDAKIALEFHNKREELPEKARSRSKLFMWYGMLGGKELLHRTYRNLDQKIRLECDGQEVQLPSLQGIVILNIPSYSGGANFWGSTKEGSDCSFTAQSFDDRVLEVVALFGVIHVATSRMPRLLPLQNHRIAQCRHVKIAITGDEPIPVQVDGEPWLQPPGVIHIVHKNRAQVLVHNPAFEATLKTWQEQNRTAPTTPTALVHTQLLPADSPSLFVEAAARLTDLLDTALPDACPLLLDGAFLHVISDANAAIAIALGHSSVEVSDSCVVDVVKRVRVLVDTLNARLPWSDASKIDDENATEWRNKLNEALKVTEADLEKMERTLFELDCSKQENEKTVDSLLSECDASEEYAPNCERMRSRPRPKSRFAQWLRNKWAKRRRRAASADTEISVLEWSVDEVCGWMGSIGFDAYSNTFRSREIAGKELLTLHGRDLKQLGIAETALLRKFQKAVNELRDREVMNVARERGKPTATWHAHPVSSDASVSSL